MSRPVPTAKHPGRTPAQRRILDAIGCGNHSPIMATRTREALLDGGLIEPCGHRVVGTDSMKVWIQEFQMPVPVHMQWCAFQAASCDLDETEQEGAFP